MEQPNRAGDAAWNATWHDLAEGVVDAGACTGCAGCVLACPRHVLDLDEAAWQPRLQPAAWGESGDDRTCLHSARGCDLCARACPRLGRWEGDGDRAAFGRPREAHEVLGIHRGIFLAAATDPVVAGAGQDGGLASALLIYALEHGHIDAAVVSAADAGQRPRALLARNRAEVLAAAGSRYTYSPHVLAAAAAEGAARLGLVGVGCQVSIPHVARSRGARRAARPFALTIGLFCTRTFTDDLFTGLLASGHGVPREAVTRVNIKGKLQVWTGSPFEDPPDLEVPLKECDPFDRPGCRHCPDFTAQHADLSLGGIGKHRRTTLAIVRSEAAAGLLRAMAGDGWITLRDATAEDPEAVALITRMALRQRRRWAALAAADPRIDPGPGQAANDPSGGPLSPPGPPGSSAGRP